MPESGCSGTVITLPLYRAQWVALRTAVQLGVDQGGNLYIPVFDVLVCRDGLSLSLRARDGLVPLTVVLMEWKKAWDLLGYGLAEFTGAEAINAYRLVVERIESRMPKRRGERGLNILHRGKRENFSAEVFSRLPDLKMLQAVISCLKSVAEDELPAAYRAAVINVRLAKDKITKAERERALRRDVTTAMRKISKAAERSKQS